MTTSDVDWRQVANDLRAHLEKQNRSVANLQAALERSQRSVQHLSRDLAAAQVKIGELEYDNRQWREAIAHKNWWGWDSESNNHLESISCPILITPEDMRAMVALSAMVQETFTALTDPNPQAEHLRLADDGETDEDPNDPSTFKSREAKEQTDVF